MDHRKTTNLLALGALTGIVCASCKTLETELAFVQNEKCLYSLVLPAKPNPSELTAKDELTDYIKKMSGADLKTAAGTKGNAIIVGTLADIKDVPNEITSIP